MDKMLITFAVTTLAGYLYLAMFRPKSAAMGLDVTVDMFVQALPWIVVSMFAAGLLSQFLDAQVIAKWLGREAGIVGILLGALLGMCGTGSRWAMYPLAAGMLAAEASPGSVFSFVTSWQLVSLTRLPAELPFYGGQFAFVRLVVSVLISVIGGLIVERIMH